MRALADGVLRAYRWQYILSGARHPQFVAVLGDLVNKSQEERIRSALTRLT
jgi:hypothetical protein